MKLKIISAAHHRNGVAGAPFDVVLFHQRGQSGESKVGIVFDQEAHCAVLDVDQLAAGDIAFGSNSWRGDDYEAPLRQAIAERLQPLHQPSPLFDIHRYLEKHGQIAFVFGVDDVLARRPKLTRSQARKVLSSLRQEHDVIAFEVRDLIDLYAEDFTPGHAFKPLTD
jgi:hypothetical protein